ncbi:MAG: hypothetical protein DMG76_29460 [Acidobacteria bacterium]|nr:MAG: hypothetical protein DME09_16040 [Candidatus Rokubacteria bacterium]PYX52340.1 MAG: hypothetical protein DMG76_29460 [Acidobacteriota bacterium]
MTRSWHAADDQHAGSGEIAELADMAEIEVALLTGGADRPYALGLAGALLSKGVRLDFVGSDDLESAALRADRRFNFLNLRGDRREDAGLAQKVSRVLAYYARLIGYAWSARPKVLHILWNNKFDLFDRTLLMLYYRLRGRKIALTAHNVNAGRRDATDSVLNRLTLRIQYRLADHIFVHTEAMKRELLEEFDIREPTVTVIPFGVNASVPNTDLTAEQAKRRLGVGADEKTILFFGHIEPYKGVEFLVDAFHRLAVADASYRLLIVGKPDRRSEKYCDELRRVIRGHVSRERVVQRFEFIPDHETEVYFKAADVLALPYTHVSQSGVLVLGYGFGLPAVAADVGCFGEDIVVGRTGFLCRPRDAVSLARTIERYFQSDLFRSLDRRRGEIRDYARRRHSWDCVGRMTRAVYEELLAG